MGGTVFPSGWLVGLRHPSTGAYRLLDGVRSWGQNGGFWESSCWWILSSTSATSVLFPTVIHSHPPPPQETCLKTNHQVGLAQAPRKLLLLPWFPGCITEKLWKPRQHVKKQRHYFASKNPYNQSYGFSSSQVWMWELDHKEGWAPKNWCFLTVVLEKTLETAKRSDCCCC